ncbi:hypothetical protein BDU57DRAFT_512900 [Ampelomyces quisqualis]|uniref:BTB domain-containing protein n=1 Tax=Ampelomyces quisqualis TaxID=50730 RepID=A0A6A5QVD6_AMPQU|nr:hypothetical protein BDU57DRAFT_512900 [Ampelomyces quisqualis]
MLNYIRTTFFQSTVSVRRLSTESMYVVHSSYPLLADSVYRAGAEGIHVHIGKPPLTRRLHISRAALRANSVLRDRLSDEATIINTDPIIFEIALQYVEQNTFLGISRNPFDDLIGGSDMMLKLVKAWHLGQMLKLPQMQNKLIDTFSACYRQFLEVRMRMPLSQEAFNYLRVHTGYYTRCEKFLIDFHAGLACHGGAFRTEELEQLPRDIADELQRRYEDLTARRIVGDRIAHGDNYFKVSGADNTLRATLQVLPPSLPTRTSTVSSQPRPALDRSVSSMSTVLSAATITPPSTVAYRGHRPRLSLPANLGQPSNHDRAISRTITFEQSNRCTHQPHSRSTSMSVLPARAPFAADSPSQQRRRSQLEAEAESSDDDSVYDLFSPSFRPRNDSQQHSGNDSRKQL